MEKELFVIEFAKRWNKLPFLARYILPNLIASVIPVLIVFVGDFNQTTFGLSALVFSTAKSVIVGCLKQVQKVLEDSKEEG